MALRLFAALALVVTPLASAAAQTRPISVRNSFPIGSGGETVCTAQTIRSAAVLADMFDQGFSILCRDAAAPVGQVYALRARGEDPAVRLSRLREARATCEAPVPAGLDTLPGATRINCRLNEGGLDYRAYLVRANNVIYVAEGLAGYESALLLALRSVQADRPVEGEVSVATTGAGDAASFARAQAGNTSGSRLLAEGYRHNNVGSFAEAAEYFTALANSAQSSPGRAEALINAALQRSNLGAFAEAEQLFNVAEQQVGSDVVLLRQLRNQRAMHLLNRNLPKEALAELDRPIASRAAQDRVQSLGALTIDRDTAAELSRESSGGEALGGFDQLTPSEKARILDAQALALRGTVLRLRGDATGSLARLTAAERELAQIRGGRVAAATWMRAQILSDLAGIAEGQRNIAEADRYFQQAIDLYDRDHPGSSAWSNANGRYAAFLARNGRGDEARTLFRAIVDSSAGGGEPSPALRRHLQAYFRLLTAGTPSEDSARELFRAGQLLARPGVAQTQAVLARELSAGSGEAARLFRQSLNQNRELERRRALIGRMEAAPDTPPARLVTAREELERLRQEQVATQASLAQFPQFRVVASGLMEASEMQALLRPDEAYYKMMVLDSGSYALLVTPQTVRATRVAMNGEALEEAVTILRNSILLVEDGEQLTYPFEVETAQEVYAAFFAPFRSELAAVRHLIFEPDGPMLRLPANILIEDPATVAAYRERVGRDASSVYDFRGIAWMGRQRQISTALSARAFRDVRQAPPSQARRAYIGFGENAPLNAAMTERAMLRSAEAGDGCNWAPSSWNRPISARELLLARDIFGSRADGSAEVVIDAAFTDDGIEARTDLTDYRIVHFATHGLLTPPRPECPARPSLMTSFGGEGSDGLLSFGEIFNLRLDADIVILSACDTAGQASAAANQDAGISSGGSFSFDGLVRAFVGAGGRMVLASHWPLPDQYDATERLIRGLLTAPAGTSVGEALLNAQQSFMDSAESSHPFYWGAFAIVGDGAVPVIRPAAQQQAQAVAEPVAR